MTAFLMIIIGAALVYLALSSQGLEMLKAFLGVAGGPAPAGTSGASYA